MKEIASTKELFGKHYSQLEVNISLSSGQGPVSGRCRESGVLPESEEGSIRLFAAVTHTGRIPGLWEMSIRRSKISPGHSEMSPAHFKINPAHSEMNPAHFKINPAHSEMNPAHFKISPAHSEMNPAHFKINPAHSEMTPAHFKINPGHSEMTPGLPGTILKPGRVVFISRKDTLECRETKNKALSNKNLIKGEKKWTMKVTPMFKMNKRKKVITRRWRPS